MHPLHELGGDWLLHIDALARGANLTGVEQPRPGNARDRDIEIGILENDKRIDRAEFEIDFLELCAGGSRDLASDCVGSGESDEVHVRMLDQCGGGIGRAGQDIDDARRQ